jgi:hypothetical protein
LATIIKLDDDIVGHHLINWSIGKNKMAFSSVVATLEDTKAADDTRAEDMLFYVN